MKQAVNGSKLKCFLMMRYRRHDDFAKALRIIKRCLKSFDVELVLAEERSKDPLLWKNVTGCMDECGYGIALFDEIVPYEPDEGRPNPNIIIELGYMLCQGKPCMLLVDTKDGLKLGTKMFTDIQGFTANTFDSSNLEATLSPEIEKWLTRQVRIDPVLSSFRELFPTSKIAGRLATHSKDKQKLATHVVEKWKMAEITHPVLMDSGSTVAAVAEAVLAAGKDLDKMDFVTNNLLISTMLSCHSKRVHHDCSVLPGRVNDEFAALFSETVVKDIRASGAKTAVLACTEFHVERGPQAASRLNRLFKQAALETCSHIYLLVTRGRIKAGYEKEFLVIPNFSKWKQICLSRRLRIVVSPPFSKEGLKQLPAHLRACIKVPAGTD